MRTKARAGSLVSSGIEQTRVETRGFGETNPPADNATPEGRHQNQRTEVEVLR
jgi:outer membrane protein OmpA-like peptidoglycan-associated protein